VAGQHCVRQSCWPPLSLSHDVVRDDPEALANLVAEPRGREQTSFLGSEVSVAVGVRALLGDDGSKRRARATPVLREGRDPDPIAAPEESEREVGFLAPSARETLRAPSAPKRQHFTGLSRWRMSQLVD